MEQKEQMKGKRTKVSVWMCKGGDTEYTCTQAHARAHTLTHFLSAPAEQTSGPRWIMGN